MARRVVWCRVQNPLIQNQNVRAQARVRKSDGVRYVTYDGGDAEGVVRNDGRLGTCIALLGR